MIEVIELIGIDENGESIYQVISRHRHRHNAERKIEAIAKQRQLAKWPHRPEMILTIMNCLEIRE